MRAFPFHSVLACSLALALALPSSAVAFAPSKSKSAKSTKDPKGKDGVSDPGDPSVPPAAVDGPPRVGRVFVDAGELGPAGPVLAGRATVVARGALEDQSVTLTTAPAGPELRVTLLVRDGGGYRVEYDIVYDGKTIKDGTGGFDCQLCTEDELVEKVEALVIQVAPKLVVPEAEVEPDPELGPDPEIDPVPKGKGKGGEDPIVDEEPDGLGGKGKAGVAMLVVGGVATIAGVVMVVRKPQYFDVGDANASDYETTRPPGWGALGGGVAAVVVGAVLLGLDRKQAKSRAAAGLAPKKAAAKVHPWFGPDGAGLGVSGRF